MLETYWLKSIFKNYLHRKQFFYYIPEFYLPLLNKSVKIIFTLVLKKALCFQSDISNCSSRRSFLRVRPMHYFLVKWLKFAQIKFAFPKLLKQLSLKTNYLLYLSYS